jgi:hypothetical protein
MVFSYKLFILFYLQVSPLFGIYFHPAESQDEQVINRVSKQALCHGELSLQVAIIIDKYNICAV